MSNFVGSELMSGPLPPAKMEKLVSAELNKCRFTKVQVRSFTSLQMFHTHIHTRIYVHISHMFMYIVYIYAYIYIHIYVMYIIIASFVECT